MTDSECCKIASCRALCRAIRTVHLGNSGKEFVFNLDRWKYFRTVWMRPATFYKELLCSISGSENDCMALSFVFRIWTDWIIYACADLHQLISTFQTGLDKLESACDHTWSKAAPIVHRVRCHRPCLEVWKMQLIATNIDRKIIFNTSIYASLLPSFSSTLVF